MSVIILDLKSTNKDISGKTKVSIKESDNTEFVKFVGYIENSLWCLNKINTPKNGMKNGFNPTEITFAIAFKL
jgi:hypothetical protein